MQKNTNVFQMLNDHVSKTKHRFPWEPQRLTTPHRLTLLKTLCHISVAYVAVCAMAYMWSSPGSMRLSVLPPGGFQGLNSGL